MNCGWVHFAVSRKYAENEVARFNSYYDKLDAAGKSNYAGPSSITHYEKCSLCGESYENFRDGLEGDCPIGCTLSPIIEEEKHLWKYGCRGCEARPPVEWNDDPLCYSCHAHWTTVDKEKT